MRPVADVEQEAPVVDARSGLSPEDHEQLIEFLESDQLVNARSRPVQPLVLGRRVAVALWSLRVFVIVVGVMVIYTFFARLG